MKVNINILAILFVTGMIMITAVWRFSTDIRQESEKRLKTEEAIQGALNQQYLEQQLFKDRLKAEAEEREFKRFLQNAPLRDLEQARDNLKRKIEEEEKVSGAATP